MKKFRYILFALFGAVALSACTSDVDDYFDQPSAQRIQTAITETRQVLESASNGWLMYYYGNTDFGGYNVYLRFADGEVTAQSEIFDNQSATSVYDVEQSSGVVLSFNEYNRIFHFFSDPNVDVYTDSISSYYTYLPNQLGRDGKAFEGDLEFRVMSATADSVVLTGKKHGAHVVMYPVSAGFSWSDYLAQVREADQSVFESGNYKLNLANGESLPVSQSYYHRLMQVTDEEGNTTDMPYIVVPNGMRLYKAVTVDGAALNSFAVDAGATFPENSGDGVTLTKYAPPLVEQLVNGRWQINFSNYGEYGKPYWTWTQERQSSSFRLRYLYIGTYQWNSSWANAFGIHMRCGSYYGSISLNAVRVSDDEVTLSVNEDNTIDNGNGRYFYNTLRYYMMLYPLVGMPGDEDHPSRTFKITNVGSIYNPDGLTLTDESDPTNVITVDMNYNSSPYTH